MPDAGDGCEGAALLSPSLKVGELGSLLVTSTGARRSQKDQEPENHDCLWVLIPALFPLYFATNSPLSVNRGWKSLKAGIFRPSRRFLQPHKAIAAFLSTGLLLFRVRQSLT